MRICIRISLLKHLCKNTQLTLSDQITIEVGLREQKSFSAIIAELGKDPTTISEEARVHIKLKQAEGYTPCVVCKECKYYGDVWPPAGLLMENLAAPAIRQNALKPIPHF